MGIVRFRDVAYRVVLEGGKIFPFVQRKENEELTVFETALFSVCSLMFNSIAALVVYLWAGEGTIMPWRHALSCAQRPSCRDGRTR